MSVGYILLALIYQQLHEKLDKEDMQEKCPTVEKTRNWAHGQTNYRKEKNAGIEKNKKCCKQVFFVLARKVKSSAAHLRNTSQQEVCLNKYSRNIRKYCRGKTCRF